jgi:hypothetical protein
VKKTLFAALFPALLASCGPAAPPVAPAEVKPAKVGARREKAAPEGGGREVDESAALVAEMLKRVAGVRGLPIKRAVPGKVLDRETMLRRIREAVERDTPRNVFVGQGELLAALELVPADYDFVAGVFELLGGRVAGFYDPEDGAMYLADDLGEAEANETLAHELAHALADQSFPLKPMVEYSPGQNDKLSAVHAVIEGDATSAMLDISLGSAFEMTEDAVRLAFLASTAMSEVGAKTPRAINASLVAPYTDGFAFVQEMRRRGDWPAVDAVWKSMPETTEQLLHVDKLLAKEPAAKVDAPSLGALEKRGYKSIIDDVMGEQGLRIMFEDWTARREARDAAAGWGGDRFVVAERVEAGKKQFAVAMRLRMDTAADAGEAAVVFERKHGAGCKERAAVGPIVWAKRGRDLALVAGPYERDGARARALGTCAESAGWLAEVWRAAPPEGEAVNARGAR